MSGRRSALAAPNVLLAAEEFLTHLVVEKGRAANSIASYRHDLAVYTEFLEARGLQLEDVTADAASDYLAYLARHGAR